MDELDARILEALITNPRISYRSIARKLGISPSTVARRVKLMMERGYIKGFAVLLNPDLIAGASCFVVLLKVRRGFDSKEVGERLKAIPELCRIYVTAGKYDLVCFFMSSSREKTSEIISKIKSIEGIEEVEPYVVLYHVKEENLFTPLLPQATKAGFQLG